MSATDGRIVWHDLVTTDVAGARRFYADLLGWTYTVEHAPDFAWTDRDHDPGDYPLIMAGGTAHGGMIDLGTALPPQWLAYLAVGDVDATVAKARALGAAILRPPFDVPGVGRNAVIRDPGGAIACPSRANHDFPPPEGVFERDVLFCRDPERSAAFYNDVFGWQQPFGASMISSTQGGSDRWVPCLDVADLPASTERALSLGARPCSIVTNTAEITLLEDPVGAVLGLMSRPANDLQ